MKGPPFPVVFRQKAIASSLGSRQGILILAAAVAVAELHLYKGGYNNASPLSSSFMLERKKNDSVNGRKYHLSLFSFPPAVFLMKKTQVLSIPILRQITTALMTFVCLLSRCFTSWYTRDVNNTIKGYNINLQNLMGSKIPNGMLIFLMKHTYFRKVSELDNN